MTSVPPPELICHRYFFALRPDRVTANRITAFAAERLGPKGLLSADRLHVTLALTPDMPTADAALAGALQRAGGAVRAAPFGLPLDQLSGGSGTAALRPAHRIAGLFKLQAAIAEAMRREGVPLRPDWRFHPHATLRYRKDAPFTEAVTDLGWPVTDFVLVHSLVGLTRHIVIGQWPLRAPAEAQGRLL